MLGDRAREGHARGPSSGEAYWGLACHPSAPGQACGDSVQPYTLLAHLWLEGKDAVMMHKLLPCPADLSPPACWEIWPASWGSKHRLFR